MGKGQSAGEGVLLMEKIRGRTLDHHMFAFVFVCVCVCICICVYICVCVCVCFSICLSVCHIHRQSQWVRQSVIWIFVHLTIGRINLTSYWTLSFFFSKNKDEDYENYTKSFCIQRVILCIQNLFIKGEYFIIKIFVLKRWWWKWKLL